ncbi:MAG: hypothetical protein JJ896_16520 [Rhodothermales bacterium]|nr:hypothetical protein [Rhodothermales bacterium]MBO6781262.1 hypothetical protein [Rhodothermales bacterium]
MIHLFRRLDRQTRAEEDSGPIAVVAEQLPTEEPVAAPHLNIVRLEPRRGRVHRVYEDPSLYPMEEKRAETDRVIAYLQATGELQPGTLQRAKRLWRATGRRERLWRVLLRTEEIPADKIYEAAAVSFGFAPVEVSMLETVGLVDHLSKSWPNTVIPRLLGLGVLPVVPADGRKRKGVVTFAAYDPSRREVRRAIETVAENTHSIRFLSKSNMEKVVKAVSDFLPKVIPGTIHAIGSQTTDSEITVRKAA